MEPQLRAFVTVSVQETQNESQLDDSTLYTLYLVHELGEGWTVERSHQDLIKVITELKAEEGHEHFPQFPSETVLTARDVEDYLNVVIAFLADNIWHCSSFLRFLDQNPEQSSITKIKLSRMSRQVSDLVSKTTYYEGKLQEIEEHSTKLKELIDRLVKRDNIDLAELMANCESVGFTSSGSLSLLEDLQNQHRDSSPSNQHPEGFDRRPSTSSLASFDKMSQLSAATGADSEGEERLSSIGSVNKRGHSQHPLYLVPSGAAKEDYIGVAAHPKSQRNNVLMLHDPSASADDCIDQILQSLQPHESQLVYRATAILRIQKQVRLALNTNAIETGLHELRCFLPDDPIKLSVVISKSHFPTWHTGLCERLNVVANEGGVNQPALSPGASSGHDSASDDGNHSLSQVIRNVSYSADNHVYTVACVFESLPVEIAANGRTELVMLAFLEEFAGLVGQDNLFKRSLLLIRAWWVYETASYVGCTIKHHLSDFSLCIMVCAIFNQYHSQIGSPLQALCLFLTEYSGYDGATHAITLQGLVPRHPITLQPELHSPAFGHLVSAKMAEKYWQHFNIAETTARDINSLEHAQQSSAGPSHNFLNCISSYGYTCNYLSDWANVSRFEARGFDVVHPFTGANMTTEKMAPRTLQLITQAFQTGAVNLSAILSDRSPATVAADDSPHSRSVKAFFPETISRFGGDWRPDALENSILPPQGDDGYSEGQHLMNISIDRMWQTILFLNFILEGVISESAVLTAAIENLTLKGPLPVGEVGKTLTELSAIPTLSQKLKEKFGGLKRFLERYPAIFVFSNDHPFNPHVLLKSILSAEHVSLIHRGVLPMQLLVKYKRVNVGRARGASGTKIPSAESSPVQSPLQKVSKSAVAAQNSISASHALYNAHQPGVNTYSNNRGGGGNGNGGVAFTQQRHHQQMQLQQQRMMYERHLQQQEALQQLHAAEQRVDASSTIFNPKHHANLYSRDAMPPMPPRYPQQSQQLTAYQQMQQVQQVQQTASYPRSLQTEYEQQSYFKEEKVYGSGGREMGLQQLQQPHGIDSDAHGQYGQYRSRQFSSERLQAAGSLSSAAPGSRSAELSSGGGGNSYLGDDFFRVPFDAPQHSRQSSKEIGLNGGLNGGLGGLSLDYAGFHPQESTDSAFLQHQQPMPQISSRQQDQFNQQFSQFSLFDN